MGLHRRGSDVTTIDFTITHYCTITVMLQQFIALLHHMIREQALSSTQTLFCLLVLIAWNKRSLEHKYLGKDGRYYIIKDEPNFYDKKILKQ